MLNQRNLIVVVNAASILAIGLLCTQCITGWCEFRKDCGREFLVEKVFYEERDVERRPLRHYSTVWERDLFGNAGAPEPKSVRRERKSSFRLKGTMVISSGKSYAILEDAGTGAQGLYRLGDRAGAFRIISIDWGRVVLKDSDGEKVLAMASPLPEVERSDPVKELREGPRIKQVVGNKRILSRSFVDEAAANANLILTQVRIKPHFVSGVPEGYWVGNIQPGSIIGQMGIQDGDIIKRVNGHVLDSPEKILQVYKEVRETGVFVVDVERGNQTEILSYEIRD